MCTTYVFCLANLHIEAMLNHSSERRDKRELDLVLPQCFQSEFKSNTKLIPLSHLLGFKQTHNFSFYRRNATVKSLLTGQI